MIECALVLWEVSILCYLPMYLIWMLQGYLTVSLYGWLSRSSSLQSGHKWVDFAWVNEWSAWDMLDVLFASLFKSISRYVMPFSSSCLLRKDPPFVMQSHPLQQWCLCGRKWKLGIQILSLPLMLASKKLSDYVHRTLEVPAYILSMGMHIFHLPYLTDIFCSYQSAHEIRIVSYILANRIHHSPKYICWCSKHDLSLLISFSHEFYRSGSTARVKVIQYLVSVFSLLVRKPSPCVEVDYRQKWWKSSLWLCLPSCQIILHIWEGWNWVSAGTELYL